MAMTLRLTPEQDARLEAIAESLGVSKHQVVSMAIQHFDAEQVRKKLLADAMTFVMTHDKELMERLADA
jgi:predicted transcriptional regulator